MRLALAVFVVTALIIIGAVLVDTDDSDAPSEPERALVTGTDLGCSGPFSSNVLQPGESEIYGIVLKVEHDVYDRVGGFDWTRINFDVTSTRHSNRESSSIYNETVHVQGDDRGVAAGDCVHVTVRLGGFACGPTCDA